MYTGMDSPVRRWRKILISYPLIFLTDFCFFFIPTLLKSFNFENCDDFWLSLMQGTLFDSFFEAFNISLLIYVFSLGGVTTSYISFLLINRCYDLSKKNN